MKKLYLSVLLAALALSACKKFYNQYDQSDRSVTQNTSTNADYKEFDAQPCGTVLTGTLAGETLAPGVYCFDAAATVTGLLTLNGPSTGNWLFKVGTLGTGALTGTNFDMLMAGGGNPCHVAFQVKDAITMTDSNILGSFLAGQAVTLTRGTLTGRVWSSTGVVTITDTIGRNCDLTPSP